MAKINLNVNNQTYKFEAEEDMPLLWAIRDFVGLKGTKYGCGIAQCGACTVHLDGVAIRSCQMPVGNISKKQKITTVEGLGTPETLSAVQEAWIEEQVPQCGYCQSGQIMSAVALLKDNPSPTDEDIDAYMNGNLCRCGTYDRIRKAIHRAAGESAKDDIGKR
ncbi:(2Fe-2S)-binding protein [Jiulongibacter sediminis]|uniref:(2Fe-2S)-binding protein n=1 Tax=Jiulongibacter sediminis TaxID=1605367 RepID=A0A0P7BYL6_9BACT|nr:(2Fe-2S)-binding protein [Jiulongibacter sediminis]KPM49983.1 (2Fe-2S)-binding protein [Jiulongibacter sediminis]TBX27015.1 (2Fe-2S)-binding protein [Jiulongibacter sediminis]